MKDFIVRSSQLDVVVNNPPVTMTTPWAQFPQMRDGNDNQDKERLLSLLEEIRDEQQDYVDIRRERWGMVDHSRMAEALVKRSVKSWSGIDPGFHVSNRNDPIDGQNFLFSLLRPKHHLELAKATLKSFQSTKKHHFEVLKDLIAKLEGDEDIRFEWPEGTVERLEYQNHPEWVPSGSGRCVEVTYATLNYGPADRPLSIHHPSDASSSLFHDKKGENKDSRCGVFVTLHVDARTNTIEFKNAVGVICFLPNKDSSWTWKSRFLEGHVGRWCERLPNESAGRIETVSRVGISLDTIGMTHHMRCFVISDVKSSLRYAPPGLRCQREEVTFRGFYNSSSIKLVEKRYSVALNVLPFSCNSSRHADRTLGYFGLLSIHDDRGTRLDSDQLFETRGKKQSGKCPNQIPWRKYGIYLAGLCTGVSMFQYQICAFIDSWEKNWTITAKEMDQLVLLKLKILDDEVYLRKLVLENEDDAAVLYFKALQCLNFFSDIVRSADGRIHDLASHSREMLFGNEWLSYVYNADKENTKTVLDHNWKVISQRQRDASARVLQLLDRTTNEVKSLQSGLFNVQSITAAQLSLKEAQKGIELNRYLLVFTIVTILFLPPTFAATFFGMDAFSLDTDQATRRLFWTVFIVLSGVTYTSATIGLFGLHLLATKKKQLAGVIVSGWNWTALRLKQWRRKKDSERTST